MEGAWLAAGVTYQRKFASAADCDQRLCICGELCVDLICWAHLTGRGTCTCNGRRAHILSGSCGRRVNQCLGVQHRNSCDPARCKAYHPSEAEVRDALALWWQGTRGAQPAFSFTESAARAAPAPPPSGERSFSSAAGKESAEPPRCTLPASRLLEMLRAHAADSPYIDAFLRDGMLDTILADPSLRALLAMRGRVKEISEAWATCEQVRALLHPTALAQGGEGVTVLDVCSGKGLGATLLSFLLPKGRVVMMDANGAMGLSHVSSRPNLSFHHVDVFSPDVFELMSREAASASTCIAVGMHLCGPLSPRLIDLAFAVDEVPTARAPRRPTPTTHVCLERLPACSGVRGRLAAVA